MSEAVLTVSGLCKRYPGFALQDVSFSLSRGEIMGFVGRNGAGKTTTLKSLLNFVHPDAGEIRFFGLDPQRYELEIKSRVGFVSGGADYYPGKRLDRILDVTRRFYPRWDARLCERYMRQFGLDPGKRIKELSAGMRVKFALVPALSHGAELLILDEPTSGLDPLSREELLEIFLDLAQQGVSILFSTHIITDLEKCADSITYIRQGRIVDSRTLEEFTSAYRLARFPSEAECPREALGIRREKQGVSVLLPAEPDLPGVDSRPAGLEEILVHLEKEALG